MPRKVSLTRLAEDLADGAMCEGAVLADRRKHTPYHLRSDREKVGGVIRNLSPARREAVKELKPEHFNQRLFA